MIDDEVPLAPSGDTAAPASPAAAPEPARSEPRGKPEVEPAAKPKDLRGQLRASIAEHKEPSPARQAAAQQRTREQGKFAPESQPRDRAAAGSSEAQPSSSTAATTEAAASPTPQASAPIAPPDALSKDVKAIWNTLPASVQAEFAKREADTQKGVEALKSRYRPIEEALSPIRPLLQQRGLSEGAAVKQLLDWHHALAVPDKALALRNLQALAKSHGIPLQPTAPQQSGAASQQQSTSDLSQDFLSQHLQPILQDMNAIKSDIQRRDQDRANAQITDFAKDKPHFEKVRYAMAQMMGAGMATSLDDAYQKATWGDPEIRAAIMQEDQAKREAEAKAAREAQERKAADAEAERKRKEAEALEKARRANVSPRGGSPVASAIAGQPRGKSIRDTIREAVKERGAAI